MQTLVKEFWFRALRCASDAHLALWVLPLAILPRPSQGRLGVLTLAKLLEKMMNQRVHTCLVELLAMPRLLHMKTMMRLKEYEYDIVRLTVPPYRQKP